MGVDCKITLPNAARIDDVADVIGLLLGCKGTLEPLDNNGSIHLKVAGVETKNSSITGCAEINISNAPLGSGGKSGNRWFFYHFEWSGQNKGDYNTGQGRGIMPRSTAINIAMAKELVTFFGGSVDYNDCDDTEVDFKAPEQKDIRACDGKGWDKFQRRMFAVKQLTKAQITACQKHAAYFWV